MDLSAPFKPEVLRPIITVVVPGTIACGPFVLIAGHYVPALEQFWIAHPTAFAVLVSLLVMGVGFVIDDIGADIENYVWDPILAKRNPNHLNDWHRYLKLQLKDELVAQRYLRAKFTQLKFELAMTPALIVFGVGLFWLNAIHHFVTAPAMVAITVSVFAAAGYLLFESWQTAGLLARTRALILAAVDEGITGVAASRQLGA